MYIQGTNVAYVNEMSNLFAHVNKFGRNPDIDTTTDPQDVWDGPTGVWVPPTAASIHDIASDSASDAAAGSGARTIRIYGLTDWDTAEVFEDITLNGTSNVATTKSYVIIHRMKVLTTGASGPNAGNITATARSGATVTAQISAGVGQTLMAIYGVPSTKVCYCSLAYASLYKQATTAVDVSLLVNPDPASFTGYLVKHTLGLNSAGSSYVPHKFEPYKKMEGPCIIKLNVEEVSTNNTAVSGGFDLFIFNK